MICLLDHSSMAPSTGNLQPEGLKYIPFSLLEQSSPLNQITLVCDNLNNFLRHILIQSLLMVVWDVGGILFEVIMLLSI